MVKQVSQQIWDTFLRGPAAYRYKSVVLMSVVHASGRAGPRFTPWPPAGSDGLRNEEKAFFFV